MTSPKFEHGDVVRKYRHKRTALDVGVEYKITRSGHFDDYGWWYGDGIGQSAYEDELEIAVKPTTEQTLNSIKDAVLQFWATDNPEEFADNVRDLLEEAGIEWEKPSRFPQQLGAIISFWYEDRHQYRVRSQGAHEQGWFNFTKTSYWMNDAQLEEALDGSWFTIVFEGVAGADES